MRYTLVGLVLLVSAVACKTSVPSTPTTEAVDPAVRGSPRVVFSDTFDGENSGKDATSYADFAQWDVTRGSVDLVGGKWSFLPREGKYVDMDGSTHEGGEIRTKRTFSLDPGRHVFEFDLAGSQREDGWNAVVARLSGIYSERFVLAANSPPRTMTRTIDVTEPTEVRIEFAHDEPEETGSVAPQPDSNPDGGDVSFPPMPEPAETDNMGLLLDNVKLSRRPGTP